jgi:hypothetical protein
MSVCVVTRLRAGRTGFDSRRNTIFLFHNTVSRLDLETTQSPIQWVPCSFLGVKGSGSKPYNSPFICAIVVSEWPFTSTPSYVCMEWYLVKCQGQLCIYLYLHICSLYNDAFQQVGSFECNNNYLMMIIIIIIIIIL